MDKLTLNDIKIKSPGKQVKEIVINSFGSLGNFAKEIGIEVRTINLYLKERKLGSDTFKIRLCRVLDKGMDEIIESEDEQIKEMVQNIYDNIKMYKDEEDIAVLSKLKELCIKNKLQLDTLKMQRNIAMCYFYRNQIDRAKVFIELAIDSVKNPDYLIKWKSELGLMYFYKREYKESKKLYAEVAKLLKEYSEIDDETKFLHYYRYGILQNNTNHPGSAEKLFQKSLEYAGTSFYKGNAVMNIGISFAKQNKYRKALEYLRKSLDFFKDDLHKSMLFNNLAEIYRSLKEYDKALYYANLAVSYIDNENLERLFTYYQTYSQILIHKGEVGEAINRLIELINQVENRFVYKKFIIDGINIIAQYILMTRNINILEDMEELIYQSINNTPSHNKKYIKELKSYIELNTIYKKYVSVKDLPS